MFEKSLSSTTKILVPSGIDSNKLAPCEIRYNMKTIEYSDNKQVRLYTVPLSKTLLDRKPKKKKSPTEEEKLISINPWMTEEEKTELIKEIKSSKADKEVSKKKIEIPNNSKYLLNSKIKQVGIFFHAYIGS